MADIDALCILKMQIIALDKYPYNYRKAVAEVNQAGQSENHLICKGAEVTLALLPNMLLRALSAVERNMSTRQKMDSCFSKIFAGQWTELVHDMKKRAVEFQEVRW